MSLADQLGVAPELLQLVGGTALSSVGLFCCVTIRRGLYPDPDSSAAVRADRQSAGWWFVAHIDACCAWYYRLYNADPHYGDLRGLGVIIWGGFALLSPLVLFPIAVVAASPKMKPTPKPSSDHFFPHTSSN